MGIAILGLFCCRNAAIVSKLKEWITGWPWTEVAKSSRSAVRAVRLVFGHVRVTAT